MVILAKVDGIQGGAVLQYRRRKKKLKTGKILCPMKLHKVNVIIVTQHFGTLNKFPDTQ